MHNTNSSSYTSPKAGLCMWLKYQKYAHHDSSMQVLDLLLNAFDTNSKGKNKYASLLQKLNLWCHY